MVCSVWFVPGVYRLALSRRGRDGGRATGLEMHVVIAASQASAEAGPLRSRPASGHCHALHGPPARLVRKLTTATKKTIP